MNNLKDDLIKKYQKEYQLKNKNLLSIKKKNYYQKNKESIKEKTKNYRLKNKKIYKNYNKKYNEKNKKSKYLYNKEYYQKNKELLKNKSKEYRNRNKKILSIKAKIKRQKEKKLKNKKLKLKYQKDFKYKIICNLRSRFKMALKNKIKLDKTLNLIGCSIDDLKIYLESQFKPGMGWENHGRFGWHIDHIKPCSSFDLTKLEEQKACFHYTNLQPLWWDENLNKGSKVI